MYKRHIIGQNGENIVANYLLKNNYKILDKNFRCRQGEIDIIAKDKNELVFIEVKTRTNTHYGRPAEAVNYNKQNHMIKSIKFYLHIKKLENSFIRIDVIEVYQKSDKYYIRHIKKAIL